MVIVAAWLFGVYLVARAMIEPFTIDMSDPAARPDYWGGPSLIVAFAVQMVESWLQQQLLQPSFGVAVPVDRLRFALARG